MLPGTTGEACWPSYPIRASSGRGRPGAYFAPAEGVKPGHRDNRDTLPTRRTAGSKDPGCKNPRRQECSAAENSRVYLDLAPLDCAGQVKTPELHLRGSGQSELE